MTKMLFNYTQKLYKEIELIIGKINDRNQMESKWDIPDMLKSRWQWAINKDHSWVVLTKGNLNRNKRTKKSTSVSSLYILLKISP